jgi:hypothetical protein
VHQSSSFHSAQFTLRTPPKSRCFTLLSRERVKTIKLTASTLHFYSSIHSPIGSIVPRLIGINQYDTGRSVSGNSFLFSFARIKHDRLSLLQRLHTLVNATGYKQLLYSINPSIILSATQRFLRKQPIMKFQNSVLSGAGAAIILVLPTPAAGHSWIERALKVEPTTRQFFGSEGFPRGYIPRTDPAFNDEDYIWRLPYTGTAYYTGEENINKYPFNANPSHAMLEAAPGDFIAILHFENGHTTVPESSPDKPLNRGTIFLYGTDDPRDEEKLFDVHLAWNKDGTGGDKRGRLLSTRNYDDGQCYEARGEGLALQRATTLGVDPMTPLACQSDLQLPDDLEPGSIYTIYWYWDWPNLNKEEIDMAATENGLFPWAGTFMRGQEDPNGFTMNAIATNESYASTIDIKIVSKDSEMAAKGQVGSHSSGEGTDQGTVFNMAIAAQLQSNYGVEVDPNAGNDGNQPPVNQPPVDSPPASSPPAPAPTSGDPATVTVTVTQPPVTVPTTIYVTQLPETPESSIPSSDAASSTPTMPAITPSGSPTDTTAIPTKSTCSSETPQVVTEIETQYTTVYPEGTPTDGGVFLAGPSKSAQAGSESTTLSTSVRPFPTTTPRGANQTERFTPQPRHNRVKRTSWSFGNY